MKIFDSLGAKTNKDGLLVLKNLQIGKYKYTINSLDYIGFSDSLFITDSNIIDTFYLEEKIINTHSIQVLENPKKIDTLKNNI